MDVDQFILESVSFTRATLAGKWSRWLIFVLLGLPWLLLTSLVDSRKIIEGTVIHWNLIPWEEAGLLILAGLLCNFFLSGYIVRLLKGDHVPPEFDNWPLLCLDGMKIHIIPLVWLLVPLVLAFVEFTLASGKMMSGSPTEANLGQFLIIVLVIVQIVIVLYAVTYAIIGAIRFARTGSVREAFSLWAIRANLTRIGMVNYYIGVGVIAFVWLVFSAALHYLALVPYAGPFMALGLGPFLNVFCIRFMAHFCDEENLPGRDGSVPPRASLRSLIPELISWFVVLLVLFVLCFTPLALVAASVGKVFLH
jgi:hypothetical protein